MNGQTAIIFVSHKRLTKAHQPLTGVDGRRSGLWYRIQFTDEDVDDAVRSAKPLIDEFVLNAWPLKNGRSKLRNNQSMQAQ